MIAGVPGAGISALFYLLAVLAMPLVAARRTLGARSFSAGRWGLVGRQLAVALGIVAGLALGGVALAFVVGGPEATAAAADHAGRVIEDAAFALSRIGLVLGLLTLSLVMLAVQLFALILRARARIGRRA